MRFLRLTEYELTTDVPLSAGEIDGLRAQIPLLEVSASRSSNGRFDLKPSSHVGIVRTGELVVEIRPKLPIRRVLFLLSYGTDPIRWRKNLVGFQDDASLFEAVVPMFIRQLQFALSRGLLQGYRSREADLPGVRGRIRFEEQLKRRFGVVPPVASVFDDFTEDTAENRLLKAGIRQLLSLPLRSDKSRRELRRMHAAFVNVTDEMFDRRRLPLVVFDRLNERYRSAVGLAKLIVSGRSLDIASGGVPATSFLIDMNKVFENFVIAALREALGLSTSEFPTGLVGRRMTLDTGGRVTLRPDFSWWKGNLCLVVGDVKYKDVTAGGPRNPDLYQLLAYATSANVSHAVLIYAGESTVFSYKVDHAEKMLYAMGLDLSLDEEALLSKIDEVAVHLTALAKIETKVA